MKKSVNRWSNDGLILRIMDTDMNTSMDTSTTRVISEKL